MKIYLASKSPRRQSLLKQINIEFVCINSEIDESPRCNEEPISYVERMALEKAKNGWANVARVDDLPLLAADTSVVIDDQILGKPADYSQAFQMLNLLSDRTHQVITSIAVIKDTQQEMMTSITDVTFDTLSTDLIDYYIETGDCFDKAGAYGIQGFAARFVRAISGSYSGIVGLPLFETAKILEQFDSPFVEDIVIKE